MLSKDTQDAIRELVEKMTSNDEMFSAFDVTSIIRKTEDGEAPHHEVKNIVHAMFGNGDLPQDYMRSSSSIKLTDAVDSGSVTVFVYHPQWRNPSDYDKNRFQEEDGNPFLSKTAATPAVKTVGDKRGRVCVPAALVRQVASPLAMVWVRPDLMADGIYISFYRTYAKDETDLRVDRDNNIRLSKSMINRSNLGDHEPSFKVNTTPQGHKFIYVS